MKRTNKLIIALIVIVALAISLLFVALSGNTSPPFIPTPSPSHFVPHPNDVYLELIVTDGTIFARTNADTSTNDFFVVWEVDAGQLRTSRQANYAAIGGLQSRETYRIAITRVSRDSSSSYSYAYIQWCALDVDGYEYSTASLRAYLVQGGVRNNRLSFDRGSGMSFFSIHDIELPRIWMTSSDITIATNENGHVELNSTLRRFGNPVRANGDTDWFEIYMTSNWFTRTYRYRTGKELSENDIIVWHSTREYYIRSTPASLFMLADSFLVSDTEHFFPWGHFIVDQTQLKSDMNSCILIVKTLLHITH